MKQLLKLKVMFNTIYQVHFIKILTARLDADTVFHRDKSDREFLNITRCYDILISLKRQYICTIIISTTLENVRNQHRHYNISASKNNSFQNYIIRSSFH